MGKPRNTRHTRKYPKYPEIPERKKDTRKYPIVFFDTPTRPEPDLLSGILSNTRPDPILKNPTRWALVLNIFFFKKPCFKSKTDIASMLASCKKVNKGK